jgi:hypothetical protein
MLSKGFGGYGDLHSSIHSNESEQQSDYVNKFSTFTRVAHVMKIDDSGFSWQVVASLRQIKMIIYFAWYEKSSCNLRLSPNSGLPPERNSFDRPKRPGHR